MIDQFINKFTKNLTNEQESCLLGQILTMVDFTIEWVSEDEFYLQNVHLNREGELLKVWAAEQRKVCKKTSDAIEEIVSAHVNTMAPCPDLETINSFRKQLVSKYNEVLPSPTPPVPMLKFYPCNGFVMEQVKGPQGYPSYQCLPDKIVEEMNRIASILTTSHEVKRAEMLELLNKHPEKLSKEAKLATVEECLAHNANSPQDIKYPEAKSLFIYNDPDAVDYHFGNNNVVILYGLSNLNARNDDGIAAAKSYWERFCKDSPDGPRQNVRIHVRYGAETIRSDDNFFHYVAAPNRSVDGTFTPVRVS